jgi:hypothetical protein
MYGRSIVIAAIAVTACGRSSSPPPSPPPEFEAWDLAGRMRALAGVWKDGIFVVEMNADGAREKFGSDDDDRASWWHGYLSRTPCALSWGEEEQYSTSEWPLQYVIKDGAVYFVGSGTGIRHGADAIACAGPDEVWTLHAGACTHWHRYYDAWRSAPGVCGLLRDGDHDMFYEMEQLVGLRVMHVEGDAIWEGRLGRPAMKVGSFAATEPREDSSPTPPPPPAPRPPDDPSTVSGLARVIGDGRAWNGRAVSAHGRYIADAMLNDAMLHGQGSTSRYTIALVSGNGDWDVLLCQPDAPQTGFHAGDRVVVEGTVQANEMLRPLVAHCKLRRE